MTADPSPTTPATGSCLCGDVRFEISGPLRPVSICHCGMCRRASTSLGAYTACAPGDIVVTGEPRWYRSSPIARRGFCARCGSTLFWEPSHGGHLSVALGSLDDQSGLAIERHIFVADDTSALRAFAPADG